MNGSNLLVALPLLIACGSSDAPPAAPADTSSPAGEKPSSSGLSAASCQAQGGKVVGDIGDGAIHRPGYKCAESGEPPLGSIVPDPDGPVAIEGAVCCK